MKAEQYYSEKRRSFLEGGRVLIWFSCGVTSAVAAKIASDKYKDTKTVEVLYCDTGGEHPSNRIFLKDVEKWLGIKIRVLKNKRYKDHFDLFQKKKHLNRGGIVLCTQELKKSLRQKYEDPVRDIQIFGFDTSEVSRLQRFRDANEEVYVETPLIETGLTKNDCLAIVQSVGLRLPITYFPQKSGAPYKHANCLGCVRGSAKYWSKIRIDFPKVFHKMAKIEQEVGDKIVKYKGQWTALYDLPLEVEDDDPDYNFECSILCGDFLSSIEGENKGGE
jgi:PP-loop superfamily ATP-utilizing enzyme